MMIYLSPGVYIEELNSDAKLMKGVSTSTAGFIGLAEKGPVEGSPQLVTNFSEFKRIYGGYLSKNEFGEYRFLAYAVENFFVNGGSRCYISRVVPSDSKCSASDFIGVDNGPDKRTGIKAFLDNEEISIIAVPGVTEPNVQLALIAHCENLENRFAVLDLPRDVAKAQDIINHCSKFDSSFAAFYHPWLTVVDPLVETTIAIPPSGSVMGIYARSDSSKGVYKAPANEVVKACGGLNYQFNKEEQDILTPKGINLIREIPDRGICLWGAQTLSSDESWKYIKVRRLFIFIQETIKTNTHWTVSETNDEALWRKVNDSINVFLNGLFKEGALAGNTPEEAFYVEVGLATTSLYDIEHGKLICHIGVAVVEPAEFISFRITLKTKALYE